MAKPRKMSIEQHRSVGGRLYEIRNRLLSITTELPYAKNHKVVAKARKAVEAADSLRVALDCQLSLDVGFDDFDPRTYYPGNGNGFEQSPENEQICYRGCGKSTVDSGRQPPPVDRLHCSVDRLEYDFATRVGRLHLPPGNCTDMRGAIDVFEAIDPDVRRIETLAELGGDTTYERVDGEWTASRGVSR